jgi:cytochrome c-type biogenesis protein CcmH/NrfF
VKRIVRLLLLSCMALLLMGADNQEARYQKLGSKIMCTCGCAQMLLQCNHVGCPNSDRMTHQLRANVQTMSNDEQVLDWFRSTWGVLAVVEPRTHGFELLAWVLPAAGLGMGLLAVVVVIRKWRLRPVPVDMADINLGPELESMRARARKETEL